MDRRSLMLGAGACALVGGRPAGATGEVAIGCVYPLTGNGAHIGLDARAALDLAAELVNTKHAPLPVLMGGGGGLPHLGGAQLRLVFADSQSDPTKAAAAAERLIAQERVVAIIGGPGPAASGAIADVCERLGVPCLCPEDASPGLTRRGLRWVFRIGPDEVMFSQAMFDCLRELGARTGRPARSVSLFYEDSGFGADSSSAQRALAQAAGLPVRADIRYPAFSPSLSSEAQQLKAANADVLLPSCFTSDAILILRAMHEIGYRPAAIMAQAGGFREPPFLAASGKLAEGVLSRSSFALDAVALRPAIPAVNALFKARAGKNLDDDTASEFTALLLLAAAIDHAGTPASAAIRDALAASTVDGARTIMPWKGIRFDASGQNALCTPVVQQVAGGVYRTVWPFALADAAPVWQVTGG